jgi:hypothetical protein
MFRRTIKPHLPFISQHRRFIPDMARRLGDPMFTKGIETDRDELDRSVEKQEQFLGARSNLPDPARSCKSRARSVVSALPHQKRL